MGYTLAVELERSRGMTPVCEERDIWQLEFCHWVGRAGLNKDFFLTSSRRQSLYTVELGVTMGKGNDRFK